MVKLSFESAKEEFTDYCSSVRGFSQNTTSAYRNDLNRASTLLKNKQISKISLTDISKFIDGAEENARSASTRARTIATLRSFFMFCEKECGQDVIDIRELSLPKVPVPTAHALDENDMGTLLGVFGSDEV